MPCSPSPPSHVCNARRAAALEASSLIVASTLLATAASTDGHATVHYRDGLRVLPLAVFNDHAMLRIVHVHRKSAAGATRSGIASQKIKAMLTKADCAKSLVAKIEHIGFILRHGVLIAY